MQTETYLILAGLVGVVSSMLRLVEYLLGRALGGGRTNGHVTTAQCLRAQRDMEDRLERQMDRRLEAGLKAVESRVARLEDTTAVLTLSGAKHGRK